MQVAHFHSNSGAMIGFVIHKLNYGAAGRMSAWYSAQGQVTAAELFDRRGRAKAVRPGSPAWQYAQQRARFGERASPQLQA